MFCCRQFGLLMQDHVVYLGLLMHHKNVHWLHWLYVVVVLFGNLQKKKEEYTKRIFKKRIQKAVGKRDEVTHPLVRVAHRHV